MRYRPFGRSGNAVSAVTLNLGDATLARGRAGARDLVVAAMEHGVNTFHLECADPVLAELAGSAMAAVDRRLVFLAVRIGQRTERGRRVRDFSPESLTASIDQVLAASRLGHIDLVLLDEPAVDELPQATLSALKALRSAGSVRMLGVAGDEDVMDAYVSTNAFDVLVTPFNVEASWATRNRIRAAVERDMAVIGYDYFPKTLSSPKKAETHGQPKRGLFGLGGPKKDPIFKGVGTFAFLHQTPNWTAEEICLAYALTEPTLSTVLIDTADDKRLEELTAIPDRDLPPGLPAQIEMARVNQAAQAKSA
ncbi:aldo/keto reductase [Brevundimonas sp.]|uniref:aldo/keto reductase n=1 Tax=Brevundimonas sp. TaxID=1871086 RepID=UPI0025FF4E4E|nr:aldo/keto reductase [Brevundimonas sp.]